jgi:hypothetical protein
MARMARSSAARTGAVTSRSQIGAAASGSKVPPAKVPVGESFKEVRKMNDKALRILSGR